MNNYRLLAQKIREGSVNTRQGFGFYYHRAGESDCECCAIGAALLACDLRVRGGRVPIEDLKRCTEVDLDTPIQMPTNGREDSVGNTIIYLNDIQCWTRQKIADWLETL